MASPPKNPYLLNVNKLLPYTNPRQKKINVITFSILFVNLLLKTNKLRMIKEKEIHFLNALVFQIQM